MSGEGDVPTMDERNEYYCPPRFDETGGKLGETPILWEFRMAYPWEKSFADEYPDWDQCCTCWEFATSEREAREKVWGKFKRPGSIMPGIIYLTPETG